MNQRKIWLSGIIYAGVISAFILLAISGSKAVTTFKESTEPQRNCTVVIDAGHGGVDGGASSCTGILESQINLEIALRLEDMMHLLGIKTKMIRTTDVSVYTQGQTIAAKKISDLKQRVKLVNSEAKAVLISLHQNYFSSQQYSGAQVFYASDSESEAFAKTMQSALVQSLNKGSNRKAKKADGVYLMQHIQHPGILIECGFISNPVEEARLRNPEYQKQLCCVIAAVTSKHTRQSSSA